MVWEPVSKGAVPRLRKALGVLTYPSLIHAHSYNVKFSFSAVFTVELILCPHARQSSVALFFAPLPVLPSCFQAVPLRLKSLKKPSTARVNVEPVVGSIWRISAER